jgi:hypothetical protein
VLVTGGSRGIGAAIARELGLLRLVGATHRQVRSMARWEAGLIIAIGLMIALPLMTGRSPHITVYPEQVEVGLVQQAHGALAGHGVASQ